jgi:hypothetical protein
MVSSLLFAGPLALLSRTVSLKFIVLATEGTASTVISVPEVLLSAKTLDIFGKYLTGEVEEL